MSSDIKNWAFHFLAVLLSLGSRKASSLGMTLSTMLDQVAKLPIPLTKEQEEDDVFLLCRCCTELTDFVKPFVHEAGEKLPNSERQQGKEDELRTELLKLWVKNLKYLPKFLSMCYLSHHESKELMSLLDNDIKAGCLLSILQLYEDSESPSAGDRTQGSWHAACVSPQDVCHRDFGKSFIRVFWKVWRCPLNWV